MSQFQWSDVDEVVEEYNVGEMGDMDDEGDDEYHGRRGEYSESDDEEFELSVCSYSIFCL